MADRRRFLSGTLILVGVLLAASVLASCGLTGTLVESATLSRRLGDHGYSGVGVNVEFNTVNGLRRDTLTVTLDRPPAATTDEVAAADVAAFTLDHFARLDEVDRLIVVLKSSRAERSFSRSPQEWREYIFLLSQPPGISDAVTARRAFGDRYEPRGITTSFPAEQPVFHAVVSIRNLPAGSVVKAVWVAVDALDAGPPNSVLTATEAHAEGSRNIDFTLEPTAGSLPRGAYRVDIFLDGQLERTLPFTVSA